MRMLIPTFRLRGPNEMGITEKKAMLTNPGILTPWDEKLPSSGASHAIRGHERENQRQDGDGSCEDASQTLERGTHGGSIP